MKQRMKQTDQTSLYLLLLQKKIVLFGDRAIMLLEDRDYKVVVKKIDEDISFCREMRDKAPLMKTMPVIFKEDQLIGGYSDLSDSFKNE